MVLSGAQKGRMFVFRALQRLKWTARVALATLALTLIPRGPAMHLCNSLASQSDNHAKAIYLFAVPQWLAVQMEGLAVIVRRLFASPLNPVIFPATWWLADGLQNGRNIGVDTGVSYPFGQANYG